MHFLDKRVNVICEELKKLKIKQKFAIENWQYKEGNFLHPEDAKADAAAWTDFDCQKTTGMGKTGIIGFIQHIKCRRSWTGNGCGFCAYAD